MDATRSASRVACATVKAMQQGYLSWRPRIGQRVAYIGQKIRKENGGPVEFIVSRIDPPGRRYLTVAGPVTSAELVMHLALPDDPDNEVFSAGLSKVAPVA